MKLQNRLFTTLSALSILSVGYLYAEESTQTGLDTIVEIIQTDTRLQKRVTSENIAQAASSANAMNTIIIEAVIATGSANDGTISTADTRELNDYIYANHAQTWQTLHGDDEEGEETGFHLVQNNGARTKLYGRNAINIVADSIYHLGFETHRKNRLLNEDGNQNKSFKKVGIWLNSLLSDDLNAGTLQNSDIQEVVGTTGTGLDDIITYIYADVGLQKRISTGDIREASQAANGLNAIIIEAINNTAVARDGEISKEDAKLLNEYIVTNHKESWAILHGDDEEDEETGFHLVQNDGAKTKLFGRNLINNIADSIYHLGFETDSERRLQNEDGNDNKSFKKVALWLNLLLMEDIEKGLFE